MTNERSFVYYAPMANSRLTIIQKTIHLGAKWGLLDLSISDIATSCSIQKSTIYSHFSDKNTLICAVIDYCKQTLLQEIANLNPKSSLSLSDLTFFYYSLFSNTQLNESLRTIEAIKLINSEASSASRMLDNMLKARFEVIFDKMKANDPSFYANLYYSALKDHITLYLQRQTEGETWQEFSWEIENFVNEFLHLFQERNTN